MNFKNKFFRKNSIIRNLYKKCLQKYYFKNIHKNKFHQKIIGTKINKKHKNVEILKEQEQILKI